MSIESLFEKFINSPELREELQYCLTQSQVEQFVRFKFGFWLYTQKITEFNFIETKRVDLIVGIGHEVYFLEFGHLINLEGHVIQSMYSKTADDLSKLNEKIMSFKATCGDYLKGKKLYKQTISLFSDFTLEEQSGRYLPNFTGDRNTGVFIKYKKSAKESYFKNYRSQEVNTDGIGGFGKYNETVVKEGELVLRWIFGEKHEVSI